MIYVLLAAVAFLALERYLNSRDFLDLIEAERRKAREERAGLYSILRDQMERQDERDRSFRAEMASLHQSRVEEQANLLQRIQAPEQAVTSHVADTAPPDPAPVNLNNDEEMFEVYQQRIQNLGAVSG